jgi:hypothetical protein
VELRGGRDGSRAAARLEELLRKLRMTLWPGAAEPERRPIIRT